MLLQRPYFWLLFGSTVLSALLALYLVRLRRVPGALQLALLLAAVAEFALTYLGELYLDGLQAKVLLAKFQYIGIVAIPLAWLAFICRYARLKPSLCTSARLWAALSLIPVITVLLAWTNEQHGAIWQTTYLTLIGSYSALTLEYGFWFWIHSAYSYILLLTGTIVLLRSVRRQPRRFHRQVALTVTAVCIPWFFNGLYLAGYRFGPNLDPTPFAFLLSGIIFALNMGLFDFYRTIPLAKNSIVNGLEEGIFVLDHNDFIIEVNPAAEHLLGKDAKDIIGLPAREFDNYHEKLHTLLSQEEGEVEFQISRNGSEHYVQARIKSLHDKKQRQIGRLAVIQDITSHKENEKQLLEAQRKDFLMKELNHRTKNNLLMVSALIRIKAASLGDGVDLSDLEHQVNAIRIVHEKLCHSQNISHIHMRDYLHDLLATIFSISHLQVRIINNIDAINFKTKTALSIGLIVNELATNAVKHSFSHNAGNEFSIALHPEKSEAFYILEISHSGAALPAEIEFESARSLGLKLVSSLIKEIDGTLELQRSPSPSFRIRFPRSNT
ncbi:MAG: histidine kinase N-terminal 7TM domain-containing protein [Spirochaetia bacterium]